jgi:FlaG/FlaF family flagellin (archaellin)
MNQVQKSKTEHAVSPVVGVMLMLVVTIIIAAVVSAFAGGMTGDTKQRRQHRSIRRSLPILEMEWVEQPPR